MENSIEEDIETIKYNMKIIKNVMNNFEDELCENMQMKTDEVNKAIEHILSDYKRVLKENEKLNSLIKKLEKDSKEQQWIQTVDDEYFASTDKAMYADELLSFLRGEE